MYLFINSFISYSRALECQISFECLENKVLYIISVFRRYTAENCALLRCYAASSGKKLPLIAA